MTGVQTCALPIYIALEGWSVLTNKCPVIPNRGIGKPGMCYVWERMMDRVAQALNLDPLDVRRKNLVQPYAMPNGNVYDSGDYPGLLDGLLEKIEYPKLREEQRRERDKGRLIGIGIV